MIVKNGHKNIRLHHFDYHTGWFFVTNKTNFSKPYLVQNIYNLIKNELVDLITKTKGVGLDYLTIMPNHIHTILIFEKCNLTLSEFWRRYKAITTLKAKRSGFQDMSLWQKNYFEHVIRNEEALAKIREYLEANPYKENLPIKEIYQNIVIKVR